MLLLAILAIGPLQAAPDGSDTGLKATEPSVEGRPSVPASSEWGMMLMVMFVLTASTAALLGGGMGQREAHDSIASMRRSGIEVEPARPSEPAATAASESRSRSKRGKPKLDPEQRQLGRRGWHVSRRKLPTHGRPGGRRNGPGCRGVR